MNEKLIAQIQNKMESKSTEELIDILEENNREVWSNEAFEAMQRILTARGVKPPTLLSEVPSANNEAATHVTIQVANIPINQMKGKTDSSCISDEKIYTYNSYGELKKNIIDGNVKRNYAARIIKNEEDTQKVAWSNVENISNGIAELKSLYNPVWSHTMKGFGYGAIVGIVIKALDTTWLLFSVDQTTGFIWLLIVGSLFLTKWWKWAPIVPMIISFKVGVKANLFITFLAVMLVGAIFGGPAGMVIGTIVGRIRLNKIDRAPDAYQEGLSIYMKGFFAPLIFLVAAVIGYVFWFTPMMVKWLS